MNGEAQAPLDTSVAFETPEHIVFQYRVAGPARRLVAHLLDLLICYGAIVLLGVVILLVTMGSLSNAKMLTETASAGVGIVLLALFAAQWLFFVVLEGLFGRTPGKMAVGIRVVTTTGRPIDWRAAMLRNLLRTADLLPIGYVVGVASMALSSRFQRLGDLVAGTMVIVPEATGVASAFELSPPADPRELALLPHTVVLDIDERAAIELFLRRRHALGPAREDELARMLAGPLAARFGAHHPNPSRLLALLYDRAVNTGRHEAPASSSLRSPAQEAL